MADKKITELDLGTPTTTDITLFVDDPSGTPVTKKATIASILALLGIGDLIDITALTEKEAIHDDDLFLLYDSQASNALKKCDLYHIWDSIDDTIKAEIAIAAMTLTNKRITKRVYSFTSASGLTPNITDYDMQEITALAEAITINNHASGTPTDGQQMLFRIKDDGTGRAITWNAAYRAIGVTLPTTTVASKTMYVGFMWNSADSKWDCIAVAEES